MATFLDDDAGLGRDMSSEAQRPISRRSLLAGAVLAGTVGPLRSATAISDGLCDVRKNAAPTPLPVLICTDLYRPFADPDDHFDLASLYALMQLGHYDLRAILIDYPPPRHNGDPDVQAVAQMNAITGRTVPVIIGSPRPFDAGGTRVADVAVELSRAPGAKAILDVLRQSASPVVIHIAGSSRDVAIASHVEPHLFERKCAAVYLNAGSGTRDQNLAKRLEYNVELDPASFAAIFHLPCPVYWLPCFEAGPGPNGESALAGPHASLYSFPQKDVLPHLSDRLQNYFAFAYRQGERNRAFEEKAPRANWLRSLDGKRDDDTINFWGTFPREMWCTAGFLHAARLTVGHDGSIVPAREESDPLFTFDPVQVECKMDGITSWSPGRESPSRQILTVRDEARYPAAMTAALLHLLRALA